MKNSFRLFAALGFCATLGTSLFSSASAQPPAPKMGGKMGGPGAGGPGGRMRGGGMRGMGRMAKELNLTSAQQTKLKAINEAGRPQMMAIFENKSLTRDQRMAKMRAMREASMKKVNAILTPAQRTKWQAVMKERRANRPGRM